MSGRLDLEIIDLDPISKNRLLPRHRQVMSSIDIGCEDGHIFPQARQALAQSRHRLYRTSVTPSRGIARDHVEEFHSLFAIRSVTSGLEPRQSRSLTHAVTGFPRRLSVSAREK